MSTQTLKWKLDLSRGSVSFGQLRPFTGTSYRLEIDGGESGSAYVAYLLSCDGRRVLAKSSFDGESSSIAFDSADLRKEFARVPHEPRAFHVFVRSGTWDGGRVVEESTVAEGDLTVVWNPLWTESGTGQAFTTVGPPGPPGERGSDGVGIARIEPRGSDAAGNALYALVLTDGRESVIVVPRGEQGRFAIEYVEDAERGLHRVLAVVNQDGEWTMSVDGAAIDGGGVGRNVDLALSVFRNTANIARLQADQTIRAAAAAGKE